MPVQNAEIAAMFDQAAECSRRRHRPGRKIIAVDNDLHDLLRKPDPDGDACARAINRRTCEQYAASQQRNKSDPDISEPSTPPARAELH